MAGNREEMERIGAATRFRTGDEQAKTAKKGGKASGVSRRRKKSMQEAVKTILSMQAANPKVLKKLSDYGIGGDEASYQNAVIIAMLGKALNGSERAAEFLRDTAGENPRDKARKAELELKKEELKLSRENGRNGNAALDAYIDAMLEKWSGEDGGS